ncbi:hypothetical protein GCM10011380_12240 [Sphingomonas metalli]|uniref:Tetratricopeptide repeat protein n=1 Tax=Sphingomonas metalli TaxID=1779358 RepID=A0A916T1H9_9SPHN|nr:tetratricopeptide repeat protein [Sphingomonas metalli]GGB24229.1 hypothetical protein GCM10011380_12240 [Sphingomonas metalli]
MTAKVHLHGRTTLLAILLAGASLLGGCKSAAERAAAAMAQGQQLAAAGQYAAAQQQFDIAVQARDDLPDLWMMRARNQIALGDYSGAYASYRNALDQDRTNREALDAMAQLSLASKRFDDARDYGEQILALAPQDPTGLLVTASVAFEMGRFQAASDTVRQLLKVAPDNERGLVLLGRLEERRGRLQEAAALVEPIFKQRGGGDELRALLAKIYGDQADGKGLLAIAQRDAADRPRDPKVMQTLAQRQATVGGIAAALDALNTAHTVKPGDAMRAETVLTLARADVAPAAIVAAASGLVSPQVDLVTALAEYAIARGDYRAAAALVARLPAGNGEDRTDQEGLRAFIAAAGGQMQDASRRADAVLAIDSGEPYALMARSQVELAGRNLDAALRDARLVVSQNQQFATGYAFLARVLNARGDRILADKTLFDGNNGDKANPLALRQLVMLLVARGRSGDALSYVRRYTIENRDVPAGWTMRQALCRSTGDAACVQRATAVLARLRGGDGPAPRIPDDELESARDLRDVYGDAGDDGDDGTAATAAAGNAQ